MFKYVKKLFYEILGLLIIISIALANWRWPLYDWLDDKVMYRFIWLGIFFILLDIFIEIIISSLKELNLIVESVNFSKDIHKLSKEFYLISKVSLPNSLLADYIAIGSSGIWLIEVKDNGGKIEFNGDDIIQGGTVLKGLTTKVLEKSYTLADFVKKNIKNGDVKVAPVIAFTSSKVNLDSVPKMIKGVYIISRQNTVSLIENTDFQLIDKNMAEEVFKILKNKSK